ncbi:NACHT domain protein [Talaromyces proteolyticus]|uniref:NACHT domain protein n=1 Tax=Talaromyces proteolyticus TaxID=1131652 RepID=A0AAD4L511_9EURO|nr:NACHT domain protein [Talaromyces proteolyticus]KAH8706013.1 NACHT domain protein [Talaromyces proteolyticus]
MAPGLQAETPSHPLSPIPGTLGLGHWRRVSGGILDIDSISNGPPRSVTSRRVSRKTVAANESSTISNVVYTLKRRSVDELGALTSSKLLNATHSTILEWIRHQRMSKLPPEGSSYDKVLAWAQLFVERLHSFDLAIEHFAGDSYLAAQLSYGYCAILLELGEANASALKISFGFFHSTSMVLVNLLERAELFNESQEIKEQLVFALGDIVTLVASVATHFHKALRGTSKASVSVNIFSTFSGQIEAFHARCEKIAEAMWRHQLLRDELDGDQVSEVKTIKRWLAQEDRVLSSIAERASQLAQDREELTCLWIGPYLTRFLKSQELKSLSISGKPGSGKTVLASVIVDHLQHPIGGISYQTLFVPIDGRTPTETTPRAVVKGILRQLFDKSIGNTHLFQTLFGAYEKTLHITSDDEYDEVMWGALEAALDSPLRGAKPLVIVIDGIDEVTDGEAHLLQKLQAATSKASHLKLVLLGSKGSQTRSNGVNIEVTPELVFDDIAAVVRNGFESHKPFTSMPEAAQEILIDSITQAANGSFLWAKLAARQARHEETVEALQKSANTLVTSKLTITDFVIHSLQTEDITEYAKQTLVLLSTADRPLSQRELSALLAIHVEKGTIIERNVDILRLLKPINSLVYLENGFVYLRHTQIRSAVVEVFSMGKLLPNVKDRHADLLRRLLIYVQANVNEDREPSLTSLDLFQTDEILRKHILLDFAVRYWIVHLRRTNAFTKAGETGAAKEFGKILPTTTTFYLLNQTILENKAAPFLLSRFTIITRLCRAALTAKHIATLQTIINLAVLYRHHHLLIEAGQVLYEAIDISRSLLNAHHNLTISIVTTFLEVTASQITDSKTEIMTRREESLLLLVEFYKSQYGATSEIVISTLTQLAEHYQLIKEEKKAREIYISLRSSTIQQYGADSQEFHGINSSLHVHLKGHVTNEEEETQTSAGLLLDTKEEDMLIETTKFDFAAILQLAEKYVSEGKIQLAESTFIEIWERASKQCRLNYSAEWEERKIKAVLEYSKFLKSQKREYEASSLLATTWQDYEQQSSRSTISESSISYFVEIAKVMKTVGLSALAISVFKRCEQHYRNTSRVDTSTYKEIQEIIHSTSKEVMHTVSHSSSMTSITSETSFEEMIYEASKSISTIDETSITAISTLYSQYVSQHRWQDATRLIKRVLHGVWPTLFASSLQDVTLPAKHLDSCIQLSERLIQCYHARRRFAKEEDICTRVYRAVRLNRKVGDKLLDHITTELIQLFERTSQTEKVISLRQELLDDYIKHYTLTHPLVIKNLWVLAELTRPRPIFVDYYRQIINAVNKDSDISKPEAFEPFNIVATELWSQGRYSDAVQYYKVIFNTFLHQPKVSTRFEDQEFLKTFFTRYVQCLRSLQSDFTIIHKVNVDYQAKIKALFSETASITIQATLSLAKLCQESKKFEIEAIQLYEELLKLKSEQIDYQEITATLDAIYEEQAATVTSTRSEIVSSTQVDRAVTVLKRRIESVRQTNGWAHEESLSKMEELVSFYSKRSQTETILHELQETTVQTLSTETSSTRLIAAAKTIGSCYVASNQTTKAKELSQEIYRQIIMKDTSKAKSFKFDLSSKERQSLVFLAQLEHSTQNSSVTLNEIFASLTTEYVYFEEFRSLTKQSTSSLQQVSISAARLYEFLLSNHRQSTADRVFEDFVRYFLETDAKRVKLAEVAQVKILALTLLRYFSNHVSHNFLRSVGIASEKHLGELLRTEKYVEACDLALAAFKYISAHQEAYRTAAIVKFVFQIGLSISARHISAKPDDALRQRLLKTSGIIIQDALRVSKEIHINVTQLRLGSLNDISAVLGENRDYQSLAWLLTVLWNSREAQRSWKPSVTFTLGRRFILVRYLVGETSAAIRLAEDIVYNYRRVHGARNQSTLEMSTLLSQLYTTIGQRYQGQKNGQEIAHRYYKKAAAIHENILRIFTDPSYAELEGGDLSLCLDESTSSVDLAVGATSQSDVSDGERVRQHFHLLKHAIERYGDWPKDYSEYERINADVFREFKEDLVGVEGVEKWNPKGFGSGKAESGVDLLDLNSNRWEIVEATAHASNGVEKE